MDMNVCMHDLETNLYFEALFLSPLEEAYFAAQ